MLKEVFEKGISIVIVDRLTGNAQVILLWFPASSSRRCNAVLFMGDEIRDSEASLFGFGVSSNLVPVLRIFADKRTS